MNSGDMIEVNAPVSFSYQAMKEKEKDKVRHFTRHDMLLEILSTMVEWKNFPKTVHTEFFSLYLHCYGECAIWETPDGWSVTRANRAGSRNPNGLGKDLICTTENGVVRTFHDFENESSEDYNKVVYFRNNKYGTPDVYLEVTGDILADLDTSLKQIIKNARYSPLAIAKNKKLADMISDTYRSIDNGALHSVYTETGVIDDSDKPVEVIQITDPQVADKIQYLTKAQDDILRQWYNFYGMDLSGGSKLAQQTVDEVNAGGMSSLIIPESRLALWKEKVEECNVKFGWNCSVEFSHCWKLEEEKKDNFASESSPDNTSDSEIEESNNEKEDEE